MLQQLYCGAFARQFGAIVRINTAKSRKTGKAVPVAGTEALV
jgi:hypothetical protein